MRNFKILEVIVVEKKKLPNSPSGLHVIVIKSDDAISISHVDWRKDMNLQTERPKLSAVRGIHWNHPL